MNQIPPPKSRERQYSQEEIKISILEANYNNLDSKIDYLIDTLNKLQDNQQASNNSLLNVIHKVATHDDILYKGLGLVLITLIGAIVGFYFKH